MKDNSRIKDLDFDFESFFLSSQSICFFDNDNNPIYLFSRLSKNMEQWGKQSTWIYIINTLINNKVKTIDHSNSSYTPFDHN